jgi:hypothetical protein
MGFAGKIGLSKLKRKANRLTKEVNATLSVAYEERLAEF